MAQIPLFPADELNDGDMRQALLPDGHPIAIYKVGGRFYATDDHCTHGQVSLTEEGALNGCVIECSWHFGAFDVTTGAPLALPCETPLRTYPIQVEDGVVHVEI